MYCINSVVLHIGRDLGRLGILLPQNQPNIYFLTSRQYWLGIAKLKNVFRSFLTHSKKSLQNFKNFILSNFLLTD